MATVMAAFGDQVLVYGVNDEGYPMDALQSADTVADFLNDSGMTAPVLVDQSFDASCWDVPGEDEAVTEHFRNRVGNPNEDPPFPMHILIHPDGTFAYLSRDHAPDKLVGVLNELLSQPNPTE